MISRCYCTQLTYGLKFNRKLITPHYNTKRHKGINWLKMLLNFELLLGIVTCLCLLRVFFLIFLVCIYKEVESFMSPPGVFFHFKYIES